MIVTSATDKVMVDIHDRRPLVFTPKAAREWMRQDIAGKEVEKIVADGMLPAENFFWHAVSRVMGNVKYNDSDFISPH